MIQRRAVAGIVLAASTTVLAACGLDAPAVTTSEHSEVQGASFSAGPVLVRAAFVTAAAPGSTGPVNLVATFVNNGTRDDTLTGATSPLGAVSLTGPGTAGGQLAIPTGTPVQLVDPSLGTPGPLMSIASTAAPAVGTFVRVSFTFAAAGTSATMQLPVVPPGESEQVTSPVTGAPATPPPAAGDTNN